MTDTPVLKAEHLGISFGGLKAVSDFDILIGQNELVGLIWSKRRRQDHHL